MNVQIKKNKTKWFSKVFAPNASTDNKTKWLHVCSPIQYLDFNCCPSNGWILYLSIVHICISLIIHTLQDLVTCLEVKYVSLLWDIYSYISFFPLNLSFLKFTSRNYFLFICCFYVTDIFSIYNLLFYFFLTVFH